MLLCNLLRGPGRLPCHRRLSGALLVSEQEDVKAWREAEIFLYADRHEPLASFQERGRVYPFRHQQHPVAGDREPGDEVFDLYKVFIVADYELEPRLL